MITRQVFLRFVSVAASAVAVGCGDSDTTDGTDSTGTNGGACGKVNSTMTSPEHRHVLGIPPGDVAAGADKTYDIKGMSQHTHSVTITAAQFQQLAAGETIQVDSTRAGAPDHLHTCTIICASA